MATLPPQPINTSIGATQMSTPISSLPLKTTSSDNTSEIDDPLIQGVLKEFEDQQQPQYTIMQSQEQYQQPIQQVIQQSIQEPIQQFQPQQHTQNELNYNESKKIIDIEIIKKSAIITVIIYLLQYTNILKIITTRLPETFKSYVSGKELFINVFIMFCVIYGIFYLGFI
jgi:hypothetical protein